MDVPSLVAGGARAAADLTSGPLGPPSRPQGVPRSCASTAWGRTPRGGVASGHRRRVDDVVAQMPAGIITLDDARRVGLDPRRLYGAERRGVLARVRPGAFVRAVEWAGMTPEARHVMRVHAAAAALHDPVFSHESAAAVWGLPLVADVVPVHVARPRERGGSSWAGVVQHQSVAARRAVRHGGVLVTPVVDTVLDLAATRPFADAVVVADHALRAGLVTSEGLVSAATEWRGRRGGRRRLVVARFADRRAESPGESLSRARIHELGLPAPELQVRLRDPDGVIGRVDFWWSSMGLVGEFDGRVKYRAAGVDDPRRLEERLWAEKLREDRLRRAGARVARWTWSDALDRDRLAAVLARAGLRRRG